MLFLYCLKSDGSDVYKGTAIFGASIILNSEYLISIDRQDGPNWALRMFFCDSAKPLLLKIWIFLVNLINGYGNTIAIWYIQLQLHTIHYSSKFCF